MIEQLVATEHVFRVFHEKAQQFEFGVAEFKLHRLVTVGPVRFAGVEPQRPNAERGLPLTEWSRLRRSRRLSEN